MRLRNLGLVAALLGCGAMSGPAMAEDAMDWTGFYAGIHGGYALDTEAATRTDFALTELRAGQLTGLTSSENDERIETLFGGAQAGYNFQSNAFVFGLEGTFSLGGFDKARSNDFAHSVSDAVTGDVLANIRNQTTTTYSIDWLTTFAGRVGYASNDWLVYGKAGVAVADLNISSNAKLDVMGSAVLGFPVPDGSYPNAGRTSQIGYGGVIGVGFEKMLTENVSLGAEYTYTKMNEVTAELPFSIFGNSTESFNGNMHAISAKLNYHF